MQSTNEAAVRSLLGHMNNVESERRVIMMKHKEAEMRLQGKEAQRATLMREMSSLRDKELAGKARLSHLLTEQDALARQLSSGADSIKKAENQEQYLLTHNKDTRLAAEAQKRVWEGRSAELKELEGAWVGGCSVAKLKQDLADADSKLISINQQEKALLHQIAAATARRRELAARKAAAAADAAGGQNGAPVENNRHSSPKNTTNPSSNSTTNTPKDDTERVTLQAKLDSLQRDMQDHTLRVVPQRDSLRNEVQQLERRTKEMATVAEEMTSGTTSILTTCQRLEECAQKQLCPRCLAT